MKIKLLISAGIIASSFGFASHAVAQTAMNLYPIKRIFFDTESAKIDSDFKNDLQKTYAKPAIDFFVTNFKQQFGTSAIDKVDSANQYKTFAVSVQIVRASEYIVPKTEQLVDVYLPLTISLYFTNVITGEVLYTATQTDYMTYPEVKGKIDKQTKIKQFRQNFADVTMKLLAKAQQEFKPFSIDAKIKDSWKGFYILDKGQDQGIAERDALVDDKTKMQITVLHAGKDYAVAVPLLGNPTSGQTFNKFTQQSSDVKKPRALISLDESAISGAKDLSPSLVSQFFSDRLGSKAHFSLIPFNPNYHQVKVQYINETQLPSKLTNQRELPNYFIRLKVLNPLFYKIKTTQSYVEKRHYETVAFGELLDGSGRVLYSNYQTENIEDQVAHGVSFDESSRREVLVKNALTRLAQKFSHDVEFKNLSLKINDIQNGQMIVNDSYHALKPMSSVRVYRQYDKGMLIPIAEAVVNLIEDQKVSLSVVLPLSEKAPTPQKDDIILLETVQKKYDIHNKRFSLCENTEKLGQVDLPSYNTLTYYSLTKNLDVPFYAGKDFVHQMNRLTSGYGFKDSSPNQFKPTDYCIQPVYKIDQTSKNCDGEYCTHQINGAYGVRVKQGSNIISKKAKQHMLTIHTDKEKTQDQSSQIQAELIKDSLHILNGDDNPIQDIKKGL